MTKTYITSKAGTRLEIDRCATARNPEWVYRQTGTSGQAELNAMLDNYRVADYYYRGRHLGPDHLGIELFAGGSEGDRLAFTFTDEELMDSPLARLAVANGYPSLTSVLNHWNAWECFVDEVHAMLSSVEEVA